jgi:hypothetical protein
MLHFAFLAAAKAAASCGRRSRASAPFPVSNSEYSAVINSDSPRQTARLPPFAPQCRVRSAAVVAWKLEDMRQPVLYKGHTTVCRLVAAGCCNPSDVMEHRSLLFCPERAGGEHLQWISPATRDCQHNHTQHSSPMPVTAPPASQRSEPTKFVACRCAHRYNRAPSGAATSHADRFHRTFT